MRLMGSPQAAGASQRTAWRGWVWLPRLQPLPTDLTPPLQINSCRDT